VQQISLTKRFQTADQAQAIVFGRKETCAVADLFDSSVQPRGSGQSNKP
jgi:hypothetical protein